MCIHSIDIIFHVVQYINRLFPIAKIARNNLLEHTVIYINILYMLLEVIIHVILYMLLEEAKKNLPIEVSCINKCNAIEELYLSAS